MSPTPILQFGTSRFLLAHVDLFVSEALARGEAIGKITIVQTTDNPESARRVAALASGAPYPVRIRGLVDGKPVDEERRGEAVAGALFAGRDWTEVRKAALAAEIILSNTGDRGYELSDDDDAGLLADCDRVPKSFPAKIVALLHERWQARPEAPVSIYPCELLQRNGDKLKTLVRDVARGWGAEAAFLDYLDRKCLFANSLVDRIVSEPIQPVGAIAEPYAIWAIEAQEGLTLPCTHPSVVVTDDLDRYEHLKLYILNLGHTWLTDCWLKGKRSEDELVLDIMADAEIRAGLEAVWHEEVLPVFVAEGLGTEAEAYIDEVRSRFLNPYLVHRLADIARNHDEKKHRRIQPMIERARELGLSLAQPRLVASMEH